MTWVMALGGISGFCLLTGLVLGVAGVRNAPAPPRTTVSRWSTQVKALTSAARTPGSSPRRDRNRILAWLLAGVGVWLLSGWPVAGVAMSCTGIWLPWLLGSGRVARERIDVVAALGTWCRRMADTLSGGGAVGLAQAIVVSARTAPEAIAGPVGRLAGRLESSHADQDAAFHEFAETMDDRVGDTVAAALGLALRQQSTGIATVLRQLADGVDRDVRGRREVEAERAESRQSITTLLLIQAAVFVLLMFVPGFAADYSTPVGQVVMAVLVAATLALLVWMRRIALGRPEPRFLGGAR
ncbi:type II secretion system protein [Pseudonocardia halophobica]|uniref:Type II secretion system protein n=1 Tax=Pseudonocardia halophobica TaxID=29401 RepID=A0A9W6L3N1_9PSEU|nr:type II secretion system protein [Pseudonocardia halophobica]GLL10479.1 type II secretion system protein [Pseudonocardia halophobica]